MSPAAAAVQVLEATVEDVLVDLVLGDTDADAAYWRLLHAGLAAEPLMAEAS